jgi:hypothetical protein
MVGQRQDGVLGLVQRALSRGAHHIWFQRSESKDRELVAKRLVSKQKLLPKWLFEKHDHKLYSSKKFD